MNKILVLGASGFIGTNLINKLIQDEQNIITAFDIRARENVRYDSDRFTFVAGSFNQTCDFDALTSGQDVVYHLISTTVPKTSNNNIAEEMDINVLTTAKLLDASVKNNVKKVVFLSSGGTVYGIGDGTPFKETDATNPISSYGVQKLMIEKLLYLYNYLHKLDYRIIRLSNPYGPYQQPNGVLGVITTFIYKALNGEKITVYGDGSVVRDFIYIDDAIDGIIKIVSIDTQKTTEKCFNLGSGKGISINEVITLISQTLNLTLDVSYQDGFVSDVPINVLDISAFQNFAGVGKVLSLRDGILRTADFLRK